MNIRNFTRYSIFTLCYTVAVILWGAYVRATGSGAGCGDHWPLCNGEVIPRPENIQTLIEFAHRATSGLNLVLVVALYFFARKLPATFAAVLRPASRLAVIAIFMEAILGAGLVLLKLVEFDQSVARAVSIALHLVNTMFLLSTLVTVVFSAKQLGRPLHPGERLREGFLPADRMFLTTLTVFILLSMMGAIAALGDTLFPATSILHGISQDLHPDSHFLVRLRVIHPVIAVVWTMMVFGWSKKFETIDRLPVRNAVLGSVITQFCLGFLNWILMAPSYMQVLHLLMADVTFIAFWWSGLVNETRESR